MVKKIVAVALFLILLYNFFVTRIASNLWRASQTQWQSNVIRAQRFMYNNTDTFNNVIIGTSLSARIVTDSLPKTYNLSFGGLSIYDGLYILTHKSSIPQNVFIEMNYALRKAKPDFIESLYSPVLYYPRAKLLSFRADKEPMAIAGSRLNAMVTRPFVAHLKSFFGLLPGKENAPIHIVSDQSDPFLRYQDSVYSKLPDSAQVKSSLILLENYLRILQEKKVNIIFFEMPVNFRLQDKPASNFARAFWYNNFSASTFHYITLPEKVMYHTTDGVHLDVPEAMEYTSYFKSKMQSYLH